MRLRRSVAYTHGHDFDETKTLIDGVCDVVLIDLEDGVKPLFKPAARQGAREMLQTWDFKGKERVVRINPVDSQYYELDMKEVIEPGIPDSVRLPKCDSVESALKVDADLAAIEERRGLARNTIELWAMIESPIGIRNAYDVATCCDRVTVLTIGMEDLHRAMGLTRYYVDADLDLLYARQKIVLDAKAAGVQVLDTVLLTRDDSLNRRFTIISKRMGFDGRAVHGNAEAEFANKTYYPSPETFDWAERVVKAYEEDEKNSEKANEPTIVDGLSVCWAMYQKALSFLALRKATEGKQVGQWRRGHDG